MKKLNLLIALTFGFLFFSCSSDDDSSNQNNNNQSGFNYNGTFYPTNDLYLNYTDSGPTNSSISIIMISEDLLSNCEVSDVNYVLIEFATSSPDILLEQETYTNSEYDFFDYVVFENGVFDSDCDLTTSDMILNDSINNLMASPITLTINSISNNSINLNFSLTRDDGSIISGSYTGNYTDVSNL
jgi:hypothetical protein